MKKGLIFIILGFLDTSVYAAEPITSSTDAEIRQLQRDEALQKQIQPTATVQTGLEKQLQRALLHKAILEGFFSNIISR